MEVLNPDFKLVNVNNFTAKQGSYIFIPSCLERNFAHLVNIGNIPNALLIMSLHLSHQRITYERQRLDT